MIHPCKRRSQNHGDLRRVEILTPIILLTLRDYLGTKHHESGECTKMEKGKPSPAGQTGNKRVNLHTY